MELRTYTMSLYEDDDLTVQAKSIEEARKQFARLADVPAHTITKAMIRLVATH
jgi:hypothetical protein